MTVATLEYMALPEGVYALVEATLYLATAPKSNTSNDYFKAYAKVEEDGKVEVPKHLQDGNRDPATWATAKAMFTRTPSLATTSASSVCPRHCWARTSTLRQSRVTRPR